jgi:hypothetical protein
MNFFQNTGNVVTKYSFESTQHCETSDPRNTGYKWAISHLYNSFPISDNFLYRASPFLGEFIDWGQVAWEEDFSYKKYFLELLFPYSE